MADNIEVTQGSGTTIKTKDIGGVHHQGTILYDENGDSTVAYAKAVITTETPTITAGAYSAKDAVGDKLYFYNAARVSGGHGIINSVVIVDDDDEKAGLELWLYDQNFNANSDNDPFTPTDGDNETLIGVIPISSADYFSAGNNGCACIRGVGLEFKATGSTTIYGQLKCTGTPSYSSTSDLTIKLAIEYLD